MGGFRQHCKNAEASPYLWIRSSDRPIGNRRDVRNSAVPGGARTSADKAAVRLRVTEPRLIESSADRRRSRRGLRRAAQAPRLVLQGPAHKDTP
jgi:hypothetical protein